MALLLVENAADVNKQNEEGRTALHYAAKQGLEEMAQLLIVRGAKQTILDKQGKTPYDMGNAAMRHAFINAGKDKPKLTKQQRAAIARAARIEREKKKQQEDLLRAQEEQAEAAAERARRQNEEYAARIEVRAVGVLCRKWCSQSYCCYATHGHSPCLTLLLPLTTPHTNCSRPPWRSARSG